jgi:outer membrane protein assembly factor BamB
MNRVIILLLVLIFSLSACGGPTAKESTIPPSPPTSEESTLPTDESPWLQFQHDAQHSGRSNAYGPETATTKWEKKLDGAINGAPVIGADGTIYVGTYSGTLYAINADGSMRWTLPMGGQVLHSPAVGADGTIYCSCQDGNLYAVTTEGVVKWKRSIQEYGAVVSNIRSAPTLAPDGTIYLSSTYQIGTSVKGKLHAVAPDGSVRWTFPLENVSAAPALARDGTIYVGTVDNEQPQLYAIQPDGSLKWSVPVSAKLSASPVITPEGRIVACSGDGIVEAFGADGSSSWRFDVSAEVGFTPALAADGTLYVSTLSSDVSSKLNAVRPDGTRLWSYSYLDKEQVWFASSISSSPAVDGGGVVYFGTDMTKLIALTPDHAEKWLWVGESLPGWNSRLTTPVIGPGGTLYIGDSQGYLYAIGDV